MKRYLKILVLTPCLFSVICDPSEEDCFVEEPDTYVVNVENINSTYQQDETIWLNAQTSSMLIDYCTSNEEPVLITDEVIFVDGLFILKLTNSSQLNSEVFDGANLTYDIGEAFSFNSCSDAFNYLPVLTEDNMYYQYRLGISINTPGDYCIVNARNNAFNLEQENNIEIFESYNFLDNKIKFDHCGNIYTRNGPGSFFFFRVE